MNETETIGMASVRQKSKLSWLAVGPKFYPKWSILVRERATALLELKPFWYLGWTGV